MRKRKKELKRLKKHKEEVSAFIIKSKFKKTYKQCNKCDGIVIKTYGDFCPYCGEKYEN